MFSWDVIPYDEVLSVGDVEIKQSDVKIYPNPATNQLNIVWDEIDVKEIKITSFQGKTVKSLSANGVKGDLKIDIKDRKSTRLNSSHVRSSYAVFFLNKKI